MTKKNYNLHYVQAFRGIAAILVVLYHVTEYLKLSFSDKTIFLANAFAGGFSGVDFFFVLSGFIIAFVHLGDVGKPDRAKEFFYKRFIRVIPPYWIILTSVVVFNFFFDSYCRPEETEYKNILFSYLLIPQPNLPVLGVAWTLQHEFYFYLIFGFIILFNRKIKYILMLFVLSTTLVIFLFSILSLHFHQWISTELHLVYFLCSPFNVEFLMGVACALLTKKTSTDRAIWILFFGALLFGGSLFYHAAFEELGTVPGKLTRIAFFGIPSFILLLGAVQFEEKSSPLKLPKILLFLGNASYSIYLIHYPVLVVINKFLPPMLGVQAQGILLALISISFGCLFYILIECPVLKFLRAFFLKET